MSAPLLGKSYSRVEGPDKVAGRARYTADLTVEGMAHAVVVTSTIANGRIVSIDDARARAQRGVIEVMTHRNAPKVRAGKEQPHDSILFLLQDDVVQFDRQPIAVVLAETFEQAAHAADLVRAEYEAHPPLLDLDTAPRYIPEDVFGDPAQDERGDTAAALAAAHARVEQTYRTPTEHHNPMETHATIAQWEGDRLLLHDSSQWAFGVRRRVAGVFGMPPEHVRVIVPFVGGAFGCKGTMWSHVALAAMAAKLVARPVKLVVSRPQMFGWVGHRPQTEQTIALGADRDGRLQAIVHDVRSETSIADQFIEASALFGRDLYDRKAYKMSHELRRLHISKPTYMRSPGESTGSFAMESAMDELAYEVGIDPLELRLRNYAERDPYSGKPFSSKHLRECYEAAAARFGWDRRDPRPRSMRNGRMLVGMGTATAIRGSFRSEAHARIRINREGAVTVGCGTIEQGTGSPTVYAQLAAEVLGIPFERVRFEFGDTNLPYAPLAAGSQTSGSVGSVVVEAAQLLRKRLDERGGRIPDEGIAFDVKSEPTEEEDRYTAQSFGAHFAQVEVDPDLGVVRVTRFVGAFEAGRILNQKTARSQYLGGIVWGISMALFEKTRYDQRTGRIMNATLADYLVPTAADVPDIDVIMVKADDPHVNSAHVKGVGESGITGSAAAIANAVFHATGIRVRDLPIVAEKLVASP
jgi:xanthine dehydrogenase YagR molybdenum-binding subunit